ncbi:MAG: isocitrate lyase/phosphoenolpyruvate mutase family protein [Rhodospirillales bacterium]
MDKTLQRARADAFRKLHQGPDILLLPNAWDVASAMLLAEAGFPAIATTSAGVAFLYGYADGQVITRDEMLAMVRPIAERVPVPVTADMEAGYGPRPEDVAETVRRTIEAGAVGLNLEDGTHKVEAPLMDMTLMVERVRAAREAADAAGVPIVINARTDGFWTGGAGAAVFDDAVKRANAYRKAGADCLFVPFVSDGPLIGRLAKEIDGPVNVLAVAKTPPVPELQALGVRRVSVGGAIARAAYGVVRQAAQELKSTGTWGFMAGAVPHPEMNKLLSR